MTVELCGHWDHEGPCRWPHNSAIDADRDPALFRTVFVASAEDEPEVRRRIEAGLREGGPWRVVSVAARPVDECERGLAGRLLTGSRR